MIRQFDVFPTPLRRGREERPFVIVLQSARIDNLSRICAPLVDARFLDPDGRLNPAFRIAGKECYLHPVEMTTLPLRVLRDPVGNLEEAREKIIAALDLVFAGI